MRAKAGARKGGPRRSSFAAEVSELVTKIGAKKYADLSAQERHYYLSLRIRKRVMLWLKWHEGETFVTVKTMNIEAANEAYCSQVTSARWIEQFTARGMPWEIVPLEDGDYRLERRSDHE